MNNLWTDTGYVSINKNGEQLCGDKVEIIGSADGCTTLVLADGLGSGVKANILSTLTSKILCTMMDAGMGVEDCVDTIVNTLPVCQLRKIAYSTFTIIRIGNNDTAKIIQFDNPNVIFLRNGRSMDYPIVSRVIGEKKVLESTITLQLDDTFIAMSDGAIYAGVGKTLNFGWQRDNIVDFTEAFFDWGLSAKSISSTIVDECNRLYEGEPGDDTTVACVKIKKRCPVNLMIGPPANPADVSMMMSLFFAKEGIKIVCGGTTSTLAAEFLGKPLRTSLNYCDPEIPPIAMVEGIDLVTEGVLTISRVVEYAKAYLASDNLTTPWGSSNNGASLVARLLFEKATDINFFVGKAINPAHQNPALPINFGIKIRLIQELAEYLEKMGKHIKVSYF